MDSSEENLFTGSNLVFLLGAPRSGTTWLQRLLASHPRIKTGQESGVFKYVGWPLRVWKADMHEDPRGGQGLPCYLTEQEFLSVLKKYMASLLKAMVKDLRPGELFLEKTPSHALLVPEIAELLPRVKLLHLIRDPRDVSASLIAASKGWGRSWAPRGAYKSAKTWVQHVNAVREAAPRLQPGQLMEIFYEDLFREPVPTLRRICGFLNLPWTDGEIAAAVAANTANELRKGNGTPIPIRGEHGKGDSDVVREPVDFVRKAHPGTWREDLTFLDRLQIKFVLRRDMPDWEKFAKA